MGSLRKVIVVGLDGFEGKIVGPMLDAGMLPNLAKLKAQGGYASLRTTHPAQTPVAWSTFATGTNPGKHGIFDFVHRDPHTYFPILSLARYEQRNAFLPPKVHNMRRGTPVWELLSRQGIPSTILRCPCTYPPDDINGRMLAGVGVPDLRGGLGTSSFYSTSKDVKAQDSENVVHVQADHNGTIRTHLIGPRNPRAHADIPFEITLRVDAASRRVLLSSDGQPKELEIREGSWSKWLRVKFKIGPLQSVRGMVRFFLARLEPTFELYASPVNFDPDAPLFPISSPPEYARDLAAELGVFYTTGMAEDHGGLDNGRFDEAAYLQQCEDVLRERKQMMLYELERFKEGMFFCLFDTPDRLQHMFWRFREADHPANCHGFSPEMREVIEDHYTACDAIVGSALQFADPQTLFIALSDHGMSSFQRGVHLNSWLYYNGFLSLEKGIKPGEEAGDFFHGVDWSRTKAYAVGLGGIYLNLKGREEKGIVSADERESVRDAIIEGLTGLRDSERGKVAIRSVLAREQLYSGEFADRSPDLLVNFSAGYRVSWGTPLGGVPSGLFEDNSKRWGADHAVDPSLVPGVLFMNRPFRSAEPSLMDLAPTILAALGVPKGAAMEGDSLLA